MIDVGLLVLRLVLGLTMVAHGAQKLFGWFGGPGLARHISSTEAGLNLRPGWLWGWMSILAEFGGGLLLVFGILTPVAAGAIFSAMVLAVALVHAPKGFWNTRGGYEYNVLILAATTALGFTGPGIYSLAPEVIDNLPSWQVFAGTVVFGLTGVAIALTERSVAIHARQARHESRR